MTPEELALLGAVILRRYRHPEAWGDGRGTGKPHLVRARILKVEELRLGSMPLRLPSVGPEQARIHARAIQAWMKVVRIQPYQLLIDQRPDRAPYLYVPNQHWDTVLPLLQALNR